jgi:hypothetical protein
MSYKPGDKIWCHVPLRHHLLPHKNIPGVVVNLILIPEFWLVQSRFKHEQWYSIILEGYVPSKRETWDCPNSYLSPRHDPYEGDKAGEWDSCPWKPGQKRPNLITPEEIKEWES